MWLNCCNLKAKLSWMRSCFLWINKENSFLRWHLLLVQKLWRLFKWHLEDFVVQFLSCVWLFVTPWTVAHQASLSFTISQSSVKLMLIESMMPSKNLILCSPLLILPSIVPSIKVFPSELALHIRWPKYWSFNFSTSPSNDDSGLISFRFNWSDLLAVQGTLKSLLQNHSSKAAILWYLAFFMVQLTSIHDYWKYHSFD